jgi:hypothetical protein
MEAGLAGDAGFLGHPNSLDLERPRKSPTLRVRLQLHETPIPGVHETASRSVNSNKPPSVEPGFMRC